MPAGGDVKDVKGLAEDAASAGAAKLAVLAAIALYEKITGDAYSEADIENLKKLKQLYVLHLKAAKAPVAWELDDKNRPTQRMNPDNGLIHIQQANEKRGQVGNFRYQSNLIAEYVASYLAQRGSRSSGGHGKPGDLLSQFMCEWIDFALNELPTYEYDTIAIDKINQRLVYLEAVKKSNLFKFGSVQREKNKFDVIESIEQQLRFCLDVAKKEMLRRNARDEFHRSNSGTASLLLSYAQSLYYLRTTNVSHEPLELQSYANVKDAKLTAAAQALYPTLQATHSGKMLFEVVHLAGLETFGIPARCVPTDAPIYFDDQSNSKQVNWQIGKSDLPPWVTPAEEAGQLAALHQLAQSMLRIAQLKRLIDAAYELTGKVGDIWAYGDNEGKSSLEALIFLMDAEIDASKKLFDAIYAYHNEKRQAYNRQNRIDGDKGVNPNFNLLDAKKIDLEKYHQALKTSIQSIREQMARFPQDVAKETQAKKVKFYADLDQFFKKYYPEQRARFTFGNNTSFDAKAEAKQAALPSEPLFVSVPADMRFVLPLQKMNEVCWYYSSANFDNRGIMNVTQDDVTRYSRWQLGHNYDDWMNGYFTRNEHQWNAYQETARQFETQLTQSSNMNDARQSKALLNTSIANLKLQIQNEMPRWRFKWSLAFIETTGWPFNRKAIKFANQLLAELDVVERRIDPAIVKMQRRLDQNPMRALLRNNSADKLVTNSLDQTVSQAIKSADEKRAKAVEEMNVLKALSDQTDALFLELDRKAKEFGRNKKVGFQVFKNLEHVKSIIDMCISYKRLLPENEHFVFNGMCSNTIDLLQPFLSGKNQNELRAIDNSQITLTINLLALVQKDIVSEKDKEALFENANTLFDEMKKAELSTARAAHGLIGHNKPSGMSPRQANQHQECLSP